MDAGWMPSLRAMASIRHPSSAPRRPPPRKSRYCKISKMYCNLRYIHWVFGSRNRRSLLVITLLIISGWCPSGLVRAQVGRPPVNTGTNGEVVELLRAGKLTGLKSDYGESRELTTNVLLRHKGVLMYCDRAIQNLSTNAIEAYGNVRIVQGDTVSVRGDTMFYYGATRQANVRGRVTLRDQKMTLTTRRLDYDMVYGIAHYPVPGRIVDRENILTSREGYYDTRTKQFTFRQNVRLVNPKYTLTADSLLYNSFTKIATFQGPTRIVSKDGVLLAKEGEYNTVTRVSNFQRRATIETDKYTLTGDSLGGNSTSEFYLAKGNVVLVAKNDNTTLTGDLGRYNRKAGVARMTGNAVVRSVTKGDTLFMRADTLWSFENEKEKRKRLIGQRNVLVYKSDLQSKCDSLVYDTADSVIYFFRDPVVWSTKYQMEADSMTAKLKDNRIHTMFLRTKSFVVSQDTLLNFNQVKGRTITAYFQYDKKQERSDINYVVVEGNGESLYFAVDEKNKMVGMNSVLCSKMNIRFADRRVSRISFIGQPDSKFIPPKELTEDKKTLEGFKWRSDERPTRARVLGFPEPEPEPAEKKLPKLPLPAKPSSVKTVLTGKK